MKIWAKTGVFLVILIAINALGAWYVLTRVQVQVFLEPQALAFRIGSEMPAGATDRGVTPITAATELPGLGRVILSSADGTRSVRFDRIIHGDENAQLSITTDSAAIRFPAMPDGATLNEALVKARELDAFLTVEGFSALTGRLEAGCIQLDTAPEGEALARAAEAFATGGCAARPGSLFLLRKQRGDTRVSMSVQPGDGAGTYPDPGSVKVVTRVVVVNGDDE